MKNQFLKFALPLFLFATMILSFNSCTKEYTEDDHLERKKPKFENSDPDPPKFQRYDVTIGGEIVDENGLPVIGALVELESNSAITDDNGVFVFSDVRVKERAYITVNHPGYHHGSRVVWVQDKTVNQVKIELIPQIIVGSFDEVNGGVITLSNGSKVDFPPSAIEIDGGGVYAGMVHVSMAYLNPEDDNLRDYMPGNLEATNAEWDDVVLETFGMLAVELSGDAGEELQLKTGSKAEITVPVPSTISSIAPASIPLWYFDEKWGYWREQGSAQLVGNKYVGDVKHFSFWNCDAQVPLIQLKGVVVDNLGNLLSGIKVKMSRVIGSNRPNGFGYTNSVGCFGGKVPANETFTIEIEDNCGAVVYTSVIGPFSVNTTIPNIVISTPNGSLITGTLVDCGGAAITNGYAKIQFGGISQIAMVNGSGQFSFNVSNCAITNFDIEASDYSAGMKSNVTTHLFAPNVNLGNIVVCNAITHHVTYSIDGAANVALIDNFYGARQQDSSLLTFYTYISASNLASNDFMYFNIDGGAAGTFPFRNWGFSITPYTQISVYNMNATITNYGVVGGDITGTFTGTFDDNGGTTHTLSGSFNVPRNY